MYYPLVMQHSHGFSMANRNRWFTVRYKMGGSFHGKLLVITRWVKYYGLLLRYLMIFDFTWIPLISHFQGSVEAFKGLKISPPGVWNLAFQSSDQSTARLCLKI